MGFLLEILVMKKELCTQNGILLLFKIINLPIFENEKIGYFYQECIHLIEKTFSGFDNFKKIVFENQHNQILAIQIM